MRTVRRIRCFRFMFGLLGLASIAYAFQAKNPPLPLPFHTPSANNRPQVISRPDGAQLTLPKRFSIDVYAEGFERPRFMLEGPSQEILLSDSMDAGRVYVLQDKDKDFKAESKTKIIEGLYRPYGLALWKDYLYVAEATSLKRYKYDAKSMRVDGKGEELVSLKDFGKGHWTRTILFDAQGKKMYLTVGSGSNVDAGEDPMRAAIHRYNPDGSGHEVIATGVRNVIGLRWYPGTETLWAAVQERDGLGDDLVPDFFTAIKPGGFYGWPYAYTGPNEDPRRKGENPELVKKTIVPDVQLGSHVAVLDTLFYTGKQFPKEYQGGAFLTFHGSWNRANRVGYSVTFIPFSQGKPTSGPRDFLTGFMLAPEKREVWGRPVGLFQLPNGSLLVSDDGGNKIWRISYKG
ncbi:MAG: PQQ-dependent sugar dehydrogenase [Acidobacteria bacterium]|nr:PQQ-dependent sugar dehydrogenase [Acidobacteriota bacterium]